MSEESTISIQYVKNIDEMRQNFKIGEVILVKATLSAIMYDSAYVTTHLGQKMFLKYDDEFIKYSDRSSVDKIGKKIKRFFIKEDKVEEKVKVKVEEKK